MRYLRTPLDLPIVLFVVSALMGVWASYDSATSWIKFVLILAAVAIYYAIAWLRAAPRLLELFVWLFVVASAALAVYFATQHDYAGVGKFGLISELGLWLNRVVPQLPFHVSHPNVVAGALEIALPANVALLASQKSKAKSQKWMSPFAFYFLLLTFALIAFGLLMTASRGAWLALSVVAIGAMLIVVARDALKRYALPLVLIIVLIGFIIITQMGDAFAPALDALLGAIPAGNTAISRGELFQQAWGLIQDYYFTGSGLGTFAMVFSTYAMLIDVPFLSHAHNLFLEIWIEQGLLGFVAFAWLIVEFYLWVICSRQSPVASKQSTNNWLAWGAVAATTVLLLHGCVDVGLYSSRGLPLMFVPMGVAVASSQYAVVSRQRVVNSERSTGIQNSKFEKRKSKMGVALVIGLVLLLTAYCLLLAGNALAALWYANLGSVAQTRVELGQYQWPDRLVEDIRKDTQQTSNLQLPTSNFRQALSFDSGNVTANQRLGALALARGEYDAARDYLHAAYARDAANGATQKLLERARAAK